MVRGIYAECQVLAINAECQVLAINAECRNDECRGAISSTCSMVNH